MAWYLSGPLSADSREQAKRNMLAFEEAARVLRQRKNITIVSPIELDYEEKVATEHVEAGSKEWRYLLARDIQVVADPSTEGVYVLEGWEDSRGARLEVHVALELGKPVVTWPGRKGVDGEDCAAADNLAHWRAEQIQSINGNGRHPTSERFHSILKELGATHDKKSLDYGTDQDPLANVRASSEWGMPSWVGAMVRATDKVRRLQTYAKKGELANESVEDAFIDLAVYSVIGRILHEDENAP